MKVVQINSVCEYGSTGRIAVDLSRAMTEAGIENYIFYGVGKSEYPLGIKFGNNLYLKSNIIKTRFLGKHGFYSKLATKKMIEKLDEIKPDVIHLHNIHGHYINVEMLFDYIKKNKIRVIWTLHDCWSFTGHCSHFEYVGCERWKTGCESCKQLKEYPKSLIFDRSKQSYADKKKAFCGVENMTIVTPSQWLSRLVGESFLRDYKTTVVNNGVDLNRFYPMKSDMKKRLGIEDKRMILAVSMGFGERKGYSFYSELSKGLSEDAVIVMVGVSKEQAESMPKNIIGIERTQNSEELAMLYSEADAFLNLTLEDTFPTVNMESLACGTPIITWTVGGSPEIPDEKTGIVLERLNMKEVCDTVNSFKKTEEMSEECVKRARTCFDKKQMIIKYLEIYKGVQ